MSEDKFMIPAMKLVPEDIFKAGGTDTIIEAIKAECEKHTPDTTTSKGRAEIKSLAFKVAQSKTFIDAMGKDVKAKYQAIISPIDAERKKVRDELDLLKDKVRKPLTDWENEQARIEAEEKAREQYLEAWDDAIREDAVFTRERDLARREAELKRQEEERKAKEEAERLERERIAREEQLKKEAAEQARKDAEEKARIERETALMKQMEAESAAKKAQEEAESAKVRARIEAEQAEARRIAEIKEAAEKAERDKQEALEKQRREHEEKEHQAAAEAARLKDIEDRRKADLAHRGTVNRAILEKVSSISVAMDLL